MKRLNRLTTYFLRQSRRTRWWGFSIAILAILDMLTPPWWGLCVLHLVLLPNAWRFLHRRFITRVTTMQAAAVAVAGVWHVYLAQSHVQRLGWPDVWTWSVVDVRSYGGFDPVRLWTFLALMAAGYFHVYLRRRLRQRLKHQQSLQQGVRRRSREVARVNHALRDEVARRQATQHRLDQSETTFQSIMERMRLQVARKNADGVFTFANESFCRGVNRTVVEVIGCTDADLYPPVIAAKYRADDLNVMRTGRNIDKVEEHPGIDGRPGFVQVFKAPECDQDGWCVGVQVIFWDITEKHRSQIALRNSEARKRALFEAAGDAVLLVDDEGVIMEANASAVEMLQSGGGRLVGRPLDDLILPVSTNEQPETADETFRLKSMTWETLPFSIRHELRLRRGDGVAFDSEVSVHRIPLGDRDGKAVIIRDVTLQQQAFEAMRDAKAAAEQANRTKTQFMAGISHELRTPLGGIRGLTELLAQQTLPAAARRYVNLVSQNTELLHDAIEDILDFSAIEAGRVAIDPVTIDLHAIVGDAFGCLAIRVAEKPVRLSLAIDPKTPRYVIADAKRIRQVLVNLLGNAIKFTAAGQVCLRLSMVDIEKRPIDHSETSRPQRRNGSERGEPTDEADHGVFEMIITDTGIGIAPENQNRIFAPFEQADRGTNKRFGGTGLGLAIARGLAERMGGGIELQSELGVGSEFHIRLRLPLSHRKDAKREHRVPPVVVPADGFAVIAVDNESIEEAIKETILDAGWTVRRPSQLAGRFRDRFLTENHPSNQVPRQRQPVHWVLNKATADAAWRVQARRSTDRVLWLTRAGETPPRRARKEDAVMIEPVHPDELRRWMAEQPLRQSARGTTGERIGTSTDPTPAATETDPASNASDPATEDANVFYILVVDDSPTNRLVIHDQLVAAGHRVRTAEEGPSALKLFLKESFDCILMDLQMPGMDGTEVTAEIFRLAKQVERAAPPIIALTAHVTDQHRRMCRDAGMVGYVTKPVHMEPLLEEISRVVVAARAVTPKTAPSHPPQPSRAPQTGGPMPIPAVWSRSSTAPNPEAPAEPIGGASPEIKSGVPGNGQPAAKKQDAWRDQLSKLCGGDEATIRSVCDAIAMEVPDLVRRLDRGVSSADPKAFRTAAHTLKSCLRYVAPPDETALASQLETDCNDPQWFERLVQTQKRNEPGNEIDQLREVQTLAKKWVRQIESFGIHA